MNAGDGLNDSNANSAPPENKSSRPGGIKTPNSSSSRQMSRDSFFNPLEVTEQAKIIIKQLRDQIPEIQPGSPLFARFDDIYLNRFVRARQYKYAEVLEMVKLHLQWMKDFQVADIMEFKFQELDQFRTVYPHGYHGVDKLGRPLYIERYSKLSSSALQKITTLDRISKYWVKGYEALLYHRFPACRAGVAQTVVILDLSGVRMGMFDSKAREFLKMISKISSDNYPETLGAMYVVNVPSFFSMMYSIVKPFIPAETKKKIHIINSKHVKTELTKVIDAHQLPSFLGGECVCDPTSDSEDKGCLCSDKGPWKQEGNRSNEDLEDFVSCRSLDFLEARSFVTVNNQPHDPLPRVDELPRKKRGFFGFICCAKK